MQYHSSGGDSIPNLHVPNKAAASATPPPPMDPSCSIDITILAIRDSHSTNSIKSIGSTLKKQDENFQHSAKKAEVSLQENWCKHLRKSAMMQRPASVWASLINWRGFQQSSKLLWSYRSSRFCLKLSFNVSQCGKWTILVQCLSHPRVVHHSAFCTGPPPFRESWCHHHVVPSQMGQHRKQPGHCPSLWVSQRWYHHLVVC